MSGPMPAEVRGEYQANNEVFRALCDTFEKISLNNGGIDAAHASLKRQSVFLILSPIRI